jgi:hypothetical protein
MGWEETVTGASGPTGVNVVKVSFLEDIEVSYTSSSTRTSQWPAYTAGRDLGGAGVLDLSAYITATTAAEASQKARDALPGVHRRLRTNRRGKYNHLSQIQVERSSASSASTFPSGRTGTKTSSAFRGRGGPSATRTSVLHQHWFRPNPPRPGNPTPTANYDPYFEPYWFLPPPSPPSTSTIWSAWRSTSTPSWRAAPSPAKTS